MKVFVNSEEKEIAVDALQAFLQQECPAQPFAIAVNDQFIAKTQYEKTALNDGDRIEILSPMSGG